jgi:hypothetical protein
MAAIVAISVGWGTGLWYFYASRHYTTVVIERPKSLAL